MDFQSPAFWDTVRKLSLIVLLLFIAAGMVFSWQMIALLCVSFLAQVMRIVLRRSQKEKEADDKSARDVRKSEEYLGVLLNGMLLACLLWMKL